MKLLDVVAGKLEAEGYDGLVYKPDTIIHRECWCILDDIIRCREFSDLCKPGYRLERCPGPCEKPDKKLCHFEIVLKKPSEAELKKKYTPRGGEPRLCKKCGTPHTYFCSFDSYWACNTCGTLRCGAEGVERTIDGLCEETRWTCDSCGLLDSFCDEHYAKLEDNQCTCTIHYDRYHWTSCKIENTPKLKTTINWEKVTCEACLAAPE